MRSGRDGAVLSARRLDKLGVPIAGLVAIGAGLSPFATFSANRIVLGEPRSIFEALGAVGGGLTLVGLTTAALVAVLPTRPLLRLAVSVSATAVLMVMIGRAGTHLTPPDVTLARVSPGSGFWVLLFALALFLTDSLTRLRLSPVQRLVGLALAVTAMAVLLGSGAWDDLSILKEYDSRAPEFWREGRRHVVLALGSLGLAVITGVPLGVACNHSPRIRGPLLTGLNFIQTIPSIALFGLLIAPLAWVAASVPGAQDLGISGIGAAPALVALYAYSLLPVVSNTVVGLDGVSRQAVDAASGMGMTARQKLLRIEAPLALPVILAGVRIVLVQNIGLATIAALIGGGGFGVFVFQGMGQTATDLILLGALPTVMMAFVAAVGLDAAVELSERRGAGKRTP